MNTLTIDDLLAMDKVLLTPIEAAAAMHVNPNGLRMTAREDPGSLPFPVMVIGSRVHIPRVPFIQFLTGKEGD